MYRLFFIGKTLLLTPGFCRKTHSFAGPFFRGDVRALLERYGVVFRELTVRESFPLKWRDLLQVFRRMEDRGEVRGGRFVDGFLGEQFGWPVAVDSLRAMRDAPPLGVSVTLSAADPLNLVGIVVPGGRVPALSKQRITLKDGAFVATLQVGDRGSARPQAVPGAGRMFSGR